MSLSLVPPPGESPLAGALQIASLLSSDEYGFVDVLVWDAKRFDQDCRERAEEFGWDYTPLTDGAAVLASGYGDWDIDLSFKLAEHFPHLLLEAVRPGVLGVYPFVPIPTRKERP